MEPAWGQSSAALEAHRRHTVSWAAVATGLSAALLTIPLLAWLIAFVLMPTALRNLPAHVTAVQPSAWQITVGVLEHLAPPAVAVVLLVGTWRYAFRAHRTRSLVCAVAAVAVSVCTAIYTF